MSEKTQAMLEQAIATRPDAARAWSELSGAEQRKVSAVISHAVTRRGRRQRLAEMVSFLDLGPESIRAYFGVLTRLPPDVGSTGSILY